MKYMSEKMISSQEKTHIYIITISSRKIGILSGLNHYPTSTIEKKPLFNFFFHETCFTLWGVPFEKALTYLLFGLSEKSCERSLTTVLTM